MQKILWIALIVVMAVLMLNPFFIVSQTQQAIVLEFGKPVKFKDGDKDVSFITQPGLKFKIPMIQQVVYFDNRILEFTATDKGVLDLEKKNITVNAFVKYKIVDPLTFYEKVRDENGARDTMDRIFEASLRDAMGTVLISQLLTGERKSVRDSILKDVALKAKDFGMEVYDVRIVRADLPPENSEAIYKRMRAEREKEAREHRAEGEKQGDIIRGKADAEAIKILADAFNRDPEFYAFYRSMQAYKESFLSGPFTGQVKAAGDVSGSQGGVKDADGANAGSNKTTIVLSPDSEFMKYFGSITGHKN